MSASTRLGLFIETFVVQVYELSLLYPAFMLGCSITENDLVMREERRSFYPELSLNLDTPD
jgi:hypothetical protein